MMNQMQVFENPEFGKLEVLTINEKPYFPATECAKILGYNQPEHAITRHCKGCTFHTLPTAGGTQQKKFIPEGDLYRLIIRSKLPAAVEFEKWVCDTVLPSIRKYGGYITGETLEKLLSDPELSMKYFSILKSERDKQEALAERVEILAPKARYYDTILQCDTAIPISVIAKDYGMTAIGFNRLLHSFNVQYKVGGTWLLYKDHSEKMYTISKTYHVKGQISVIHTYWTQKGRQFIYELLKSHGILPKIEREGGI